MNGYTRVINLMRCKTCGYYNEINERLGECSSEDEDNIDTTFDVNASFSCSGYTPSKALLEELAEEFKLQGGENE